MCGRPDAGARRGGPEKSWCVKTLPPLSSSVWPFRVVTPSTRGAARSSLMSSSFATAPSSTSKRGRSGPVPPRFLDLPGFLEPIFACPLLGLHFPQPLTAAEVSRAHRMGVSSESGLASSGRVSTADRPPSVLIGYSPGGEIKRNFVDKNPSRSVGSRCKGVV